MGQKTRGRCGSARRAINLTAWLRRSVGNPEWGMSQIARRRRLLRRQDSRRRRGRISRAN
eukprot:7387437-Pyramimonas_sp.AAC.1